MTHAPRRRQRGFTLLEVMFGLVLLGLALTVLIKSTAGNIFSAQQAHMMGVVTDLARGKMYDLEEKLLHDGFSDTEQHEEDQTFTYEGDPDKFGHRRGSLTGTLSGDKLTGEYHEDEPTFDWHVAPYPSAMHKGARPCVCATLCCATPPALPSRWRPRRRSGFPEQAY